MRTCYPVISTALCLLFDIVVRVSCESTNSPTSLCSSICQSNLCTKLIKNREALTSCLNDCTHKTAEHVTKCDAATFLSLWGTECKILCFAAKSHYGFGEESAKSIVIERQNFIVEAKSESVIFKVTDLDPEAMVYIEFAKTGSTTYNPVMSNFSSNFPIEWRKPSVCVSYVFRALAIKDGIFDTFSEEVLVEAENTANKKFELISYGLEYSDQPYVSSSISGMTSSLDGSAILFAKLIVDGDFSDQQRFFINTNELGLTTADSLYLQKANCKGENPTPFISQSPSVLKAIPNTLGNFTLRIPLHDVISKCSYVPVVSAVVWRDGQHTILAFIFAVNDKLCGRAITPLKPQLSQLQLNCTTMKNASVVRGCAEELKQNIDGLQPICTYNSLIANPTAIASIEHRSDGLVDVLLSWNFTLEIAKNISKKVESPSMKYFQVIYGPGTDVQSDFLKAINFIPTTRTTTCGQTASLNSNVTMECNNKAWNTTLRGLEPDSVYGAMVCAVFEGGPELPFNDTAFRGRQGLWLNTGLPPAKPAGFWVLVIGTPLVGIVFLTTLLAFIIIRRSRHRQRVLKKEMSILKENYNYYKITPHDLWECSRSDLQIYEDSVLGKGAFGIVYKGKLLTKARAHKDANSSFASIRNRFENCEVAIKRLPDYATEPDKEKFLAEIALMKRLAQDLGFYEHIVNPLSCVTSSMPYCLVMEYCCDGSLLDFLRDRRNYMLKLDESGIDYTDPRPEDNVDVSMILTARTLVQFSVNVIYAMEHIAANGYVHRDLAARNVLVDRSKAGNWFAKVADFGMTRKVNESDPHYMDLKGGKVPIKWLALESLERGEYTVKTDVWSFGVLLFEIMSLGGSPYPNINPHDITAYLQAGNRMQAPEHCEDDVYQVMLNCWKADPNDRPSFSDLREKISLKYEEITEGYNYIPSIDAMADYYQSNYPAVIPPESPIPTEQAPKPPTVALHTIDENQESEAEFHVRPSDDSDSTCGPSEAAASAKESNSEKHDSIEMTPVKFCLTEATTSSIVDEETQNLANEELEEKQHHLAAFTTEAELDASSGLRRRSTASARARDDDVALDEDIGDPNDPQLPVRSRIDSGIDDDVFEAAASTPSLRSASVDQQEDQMDQQLEPDNSDPVKSVEMVPHSPGFYMPKSTGKFVTKPVGTSVKNPGGITNPSYANL